MTTYNKFEKILTDAKNLEGKKVLYFEGAGSDFYDEAAKHSDVGNFRIRTSFLNNDGEQIYLELGNTYKRDNKGKSTNEMGIHVDFCFKVPVAGEEIKYHEIYKKSKEHLQLSELDYTNENVTQWINEKLNCDFDTIHVLNSFYGYYVHGNKSGEYNLMENVELDHERAYKRANKYSDVDTHYRVESNNKYSVTGIISMQANEMVIRTSISEKQLIASGLERELLVTV